MRGLIAVVIATLVTAGVGLFAAVSTHTTPTLVATLVDERPNALNKEAVVDVQVSGLKLVDPASMVRKPKPGEGHLLYQVDAGPLIATSSTKIVFLKLASGKRVIKVGLAANDHLPLGPAQLLETTIP